MVSPACLVAFALAAASGTPGAGAAGASGRGAAGIAAPAEPAGAGAAAPASIKTVRPAPPSSVRRANDRRGFSEPLRAVSCNPPCDSGYLELVTPYYEAVMSCEDGSFALRTGAAHSATLATGSVQNLTFGAAAGDTSGGEIRVHAYNNGNDYSNPGNGEACPFDPPDTANERMSLGLEHESTVTVANNLRLLVREELVLFGASEADAGIRLTLTVTNQASSTQTARIGLRWHLDTEFMDSVNGGGDDGPLLAMLTCSPLVVDPERATEHEFAPAELGEFFRLRNNAGIPEVVLNVNAVPLAAFAGTGAPERLLYGRWSNLPTPSQAAPAGTPWAAAASEGESTDGDAVFLYYFGHPDSAALTLAPAETVTRSLVLLATCDQQSQTCVPTLPTGDTVNALRAVKDLLDVDLSWATATLAPPDARLFRTALAGELAETPAGIGDETVVATSALRVASDAPPAADPLSFYRLLPVDSCGATVYP